MRLKVDIIVVAGADAQVRAAVNATKTIPIVMVGAGRDPVRAGLVESLARPGGNVTGLTTLTTELGGKRERRKSFDEPRRKIRISKSEIRNKFK